MSKTANVDFDSSPAFRLEPDAQMKRTSAVAWFSGSEVLVSGWAWGQQYLDGATAIAEASIGEGSYGDAPISLLRRRATRLTRDTLAR